MFASGQNVGALCKMSAPYAKCRRPMQNVGALCKMSAPMKYPKSMKTSPCIKYSKSTKYMRLHEMLAPYQTCSRLII